MIQHPISHAPTTASQPAPHYTTRTELCATAPTGPGQAVLSLLHISDAHVMDTVSPARCEWIELLGQDPYWARLLHMHRPYEAMTHWALAAHVEAVHRNPVAPLSRRAYDLALSTGDNIDNAQANELHAFLNILGGGRAALSAYGGVHEAGRELGDGPWPFWCPEVDAPGFWREMGCPTMPDFVARASAEVHSPGLGFAWASVPGNHDVMRQGTAFTNAALEAIAVGSAKSLSGAPGLRPQDPLLHFVAHPGAVLCRGDYPPDRARQHAPRGGLARVDCRPHAKRRPRLWPTALARRPGRHLH